MSKKKIIIAIIFIILIIVASLWVGGIIPKQIAKIFGNSYMNNHFPEMQLKYVDIQWSKYHDDYIITFKDKDNNTYGCTISPKYFPITFGQGLNAIEQRYRESYKDNNYNVKIAYANYSSDSLIISECLNKDTMLISSVRHLPVYKFEKKDELDVFKNKFKDSFSMNHGYAEVPAFNEVTANYDDDFFENHILILAYVSTNSGSFRYGINEVKKENKKFCLNILKTNNPEVYTSDMSGWFFIVEFDKEYIKDCTEFDAQLE